MSSIRLRGNVKRPSSVNRLRGRKEGPSALRYPRDNVPTPVQEETPPFEMGRANRLAAGTDLAILAYGFPANHALEARKQLDELGHSVAVYDARFAKPADIELVHELITAGTPILTVEDHQKIGGFGTAVVEACVVRGLSTQAIHMLGLPDRWIYQGARGEQLALAGIDTDGIVRACRKILEGAETKDAGRLRAIR